MATDPEPGPEIEPPPATRPSTISSTTTVQPNTPVRTDKRGKAPKNAQTTSVTAPTAGPTFAIVVARTGTSRPTTDKTAFRVEATVKLHGSAIEAKCVPTSPPAGAIDDPIDKSAEVNTPTKSEVNSKSITDTITCSTISGPTIRTPTTTSTKTPPSGHGPPLER